MDHSAEKKSVNLLASLETVASSVVSYLLYFNLLVVSAIKSTLRRRENKASAQ
jgi:hypothetical protein